MVTFQDTGVSIAKETPSYGTYTAGTRGIEVLGDSMAQSYNKNVVQGQGLRVSSRFPRVARRTVPNADGTVTLPFEVASKGNGLIFESITGASAANLVSGSTYQHNFTWGDTPTSLSIQEQLIEIGGTIDPYSWVGCMVDTATFTFNNRGLLTCSVTYDAKDLSTAQTRVQPQYATEPVNLFHFANWSINTGTFTAATTTTLPSAATGTVNIRGGSITVNRNINKERFNANGSGRKSKPTTGGPSITGSFDVEYDSTTYRDLVVNDGTLSVVATYTAGALSTGVETVAFALPAIKFDGDLPQPNNDDLIVQSMSWTLLDDLTNVPFGIYVRTADTTVS